MEEKRDMEQEIRKERKLEKGKKGFFGIVYGRAAVVILLLVIQIALIFVFYNWLSEYVYFLNTALTILGFLLVVHIINKKGKSGLYAHMGDNHFGSPRIWNTALPLCGAADWKQMD